MPNLPTVCNTILVDPLHGISLHIGTREWFDWLQDARSFTFISSKGSFTARHEERANRCFWYAYRQQKGILRKWNWWMPSPLRSLWQRISLHA
jgi:hypothetical protein